MNSKIKFLKNVLVFKKNYKNRRTNGKQMESTCVTNRFVWVDVGIAKGRVPQPKQAEFLRSLLKKRTTNPVVIATYSMSKK
jgi:hypothetical protein